jgi:hypothetical protein
MNFATNKKRSSPGPKNKPPLFNRRDSQKILVPQHLTRRRPRLFNNSTPIPAKAAAHSAKIIIAEINDQMPRTHGNTAVHIHKINAFIHTNRSLIEHHGSDETAVEARIGEIIADIIEDGSTLQMGIGNIPDAVLTRLHNKHDLGVHTEMFSDRIVDFGGSRSNHKPPCTPTE